MASTLPMGDCGRHYVSQQVHYFYCKFDHTALNAGIRVGTLPRNALITGVLVFVETAFSKKVQVGTEADGKHFGETADGNIGLKEVKPSANSVWKPSSDEVVVKIKSESAANAGNGAVVILFVPDNEGVGNA